MRLSTRFFISATSGDLGSVRQLVKEALLAIDCHPDEQTNFAQFIAVCSGPKTQS